MADKENILITGAGSGIGRASALRMARGMHVIAADLNVDSAAETVSMIEADGGSARAIKVDVSDKASVTSMKGGSKRCGIDRQGVLCRRDLYPRHGVHIPEDHWDRMMNIHVKGTFLCCQPFCRHGRRKQRGHCQHVVRFCGDGRSRGSRLYGGEIGDLFSDQKHCAGVRSAQYPSMPSDRGQSTRQSCSRDGTAGVRGCAPDAGGQTPVGRLGQPEEVAAVLDFLLATGQPI